MNFKIIFVNEYYYDVYNNLYKIFKFQRLLVKQLQYGEYDITCYACIIAKHKIKNGNLFELAFIFLKSN